MIRLILTLCIAITFPSFLLSQSIGDSIATRVGFNLEQSFESQSYKYLDSIFSDEAFFGKFIIEDASPAVALINQQMIDKGIVFNFGANITQAVTEGGYYNFVNYYQSNDSTYYLIFRSFVDDGLNYHEYELLLDKDHHPTITDIYVYLTGQFLSETMKYIYLPLVEHTDSGTTDLVLLSGLKKMAAIRENVASKNFTRAKELFYTLSDTLRNSPIGYSMEVQILEPQDSFRYEELIETMSLNSKSTASYYLSSIDRFVFEGDVVGAMACVDSLGSYTGDDFLDLYRGNLHYLGQDPQSAIECFRRLLNNYPYLPEAYDNLFQIYFLEENYDEMVPLMELLIKNMESNPAATHDIITDNYPMLDDHPSYKAWKNKHNIE